MPLNIYNVDFKSGVNTQTYKYFIDFAAKYGIQYIVLDEGWYKLGDVMSVVPEINMEELRPTRKQKNVGLILWVVWKSLRRQVRRRRSTSSRNGASRESKSTSCSATIRS